MPETDIASLMALVGTRYIFNEENYPGFSQLSEERQRTFVVKHSVLHLTKSVGKIATEAESADHGETMDEEQIKIATTKLLVSVLALAVKFEITPEMLAAQVPLVMKSK